MTSAVTTTGSNSVFGSTAASTSSNTDKSSAASQQDQFLKMLVAQMNNQDPMNPMDNSQLTSQTAQISTVSGIEKLNSTINSLATQFTSMQALQGASLIGHSMLSTGNNLNVTNKVGNAAINLSAAADTVTVQVSSPGGQVLGNLNLGPMTAGQHSFSWDASSYTGTGTPTFKVVATQGGVNVPTTALQQDTITGINNSATGMSLQLQSGASIAYSAIQTIL